LKERTNLKQNSLFGNLPKLTQQTKELNKAIVQKTKAPKKSKTTTVRATGSRTSNALAKKVSLLVDTLKSRLVDTGEYICIREESSFREYMQKLREKKHTFPALDTETTGLDCIINKMVGLCLYVEGEKPAYIPMHHTDLTGQRIENQLGDDIVREELQKCIDEKVKFVYHNATFDMRVVRNSLSMNKYLGCHWDTQIAGNYLNENEPHGLKPLWDKYVSGKVDESDTFSSLFKGIPFNYIPIEYGYIYAAKDPLITHQLFRFQAPFLDASTAQCKGQDLIEASKFFRETEMPLTEVICEMEDEGVAIDKEKASELSEQYTAKLQEVQKRFDKIAETFDFSKLSTELREKIGNPINLNSPQQLSIVIYDYLKLSSVDRKSPRGTGEEILLRLAEKHPEHKDFFDVILEFRGINKLLTTYIEKMPSIVKEQTGHLHGSFNPYGAKTGRFSSSDPNLQNIPSKNKEIRKMFVADEGYVFIGGDFSQQEPRVLAHLSYVLFKDDRMMKSYLEGKDLYSWMAAEVYHTTYDECREFRADGSTNPEGKKRRASVKSILLGLMYGRSTASIAEQMGTSTDEAQKIVDMLFNAFPAIKDVVEYFKRMVSDKGYVKTVYGRKRRLPEYNLPKYDFMKFDDKKTQIEDENVRQYYWHRMQNAWGNKARLEIKKDANAKGVWIVENDMKISEAERQILNSVIQGTGADITKKAMVIIGQDEQLREWGFKLLLTVHDELIGKAPKENALKCRDRMRELMLKSTEGDIVVPMSVDCEVTERWYGEDIADSLAS
jgi:DNA polymerase I